MANFMKPDPSNVHKILIVTLSNLGDVILTLPVFQAAAQAFPQAKIHVIVGERAKEAFQGDARIEKLIPYNKKISWREKWKLIQAIRSERYDLIVDLRKSFIGIRGGARHRNSYVDFSKKTVHRAVKHLCSLRKLVRAPLPVESFLKGRFQSLPGDEKRLVVAAVGSKSDIKKWPVEYFARLLDRLAIHNGCRIVLIGDAQDSADAMKVQSLMTAPVSDMTGKTSFNQLCERIQSASLLVTNDSAPLHIADALQVPTLAIFGPTDSRKYGPRFTQSLVAKKDLFCSPCERAQCRYGHECMKELGVDEVHRKALQILNDEFQPRNLKVLVVRLDRIGDVILSLPALAAIRDRFPNAVISMMLRPYTQEVMEGHPLVDEVIPYLYEKKGRHRSLVGNIRFIREIVKRRFDIAFILHPSVRSHLVPFLAGIPYRIGLDSHLGFLLTKKIPDRRSEGLKHESDYALEIVQAFGVPNPAVKSASIPIFCEHERKVETLLRKIGPDGDQGIIALHAGASCPSKRWPREKFLALAKKIIKETPYRVAVVGDRGETELGVYLKEETGGSVWDLTGSLNLKELAALLKRCEVLLTNDSGPVHVAAAVGTRTLCIFGRNRSGLSPRRWRALGQGHEVIQKDVGCVVCLAHRCTIDFECLKMIEAEEVFAHLEKMLSKKMVVSA